MKYLSDYFDQQLVDLLEFDFPLDFDNHRTLESTLENHSSVMNYSSQLRQIFTTGLAP